MPESFDVITVLILLMAGSNAQIALKQPASLTTAPGRNVEINCTLTGVALGNAVVSWYQQKSENVLRYILYHNTQSVSRGSGTPNRFSGRISSSTNAAFLTISQVQSEDEANYHCAVWVGSITEYIFGTGTKLTVQNRESSSPSVSLLPPASDQISAAKAATLVCLVDHFYPDSVEVSWSVDGKIMENGVQTTQTVRDTDQTYSVSSYLTLAATEWNSHEVYTCGVTHESLGSQVKQSIKRSACE
ncbi:immunoglobulin lambda-1 light chain-like [Heterodontus francisci]|uniref:immunoglobulin lambda-1 light chain-like n=1 Tax=Heterodontus francisci TaxID=7792 RepID=UPI00355C7B56